jgi:hypothetical protein
MLIVKFSQIFIPCYCYKYLRRGLKEGCYNNDFFYANKANIFKTSVGALKASYHHAIKKIENILTGI